MTGFGQPPGTPDPIAPEPIAPEPEASGAQQEASGASPPGYVPVALDAAGNPIPPAGVPGAPAPPRRSPAAKAGILVVVAGAALGVILVKFVLPAILVGAAGEVFDTAFGGPYGRVPSDTRAAFENRLQAAFGGTLDDMTDAEQTAAILAAVRGGLPRLDHGLVATNFRLTAKAIGAADPGSCAAVSLAIVGGTDPPESAASAMIGTLSDDELRQWFEIRVAAVEAEQRGSPEKVVIADEAVSGLYDKLFEIMRPEDLETIGLVANGQTTEDGALCTAVRGLYDAVLTLEPAEQLLFARYDVSP